MARRLCPNRRDGSRTRNGQRVRRSDPVMRLNAEVLPALLDGTGQDSAAILAAGGRKQALSSFDIPVRLHIRLHLNQRSYSSPNV